ncbi:uncharacterized protein LOC133311282 [Gastrolobium bilobum]|uniref:uncharacterized protein LOC133311282 n=1 Tax=Gastrolobium bilobum TaxID=150636 RepID=UPI002AB1AD3F|nr:uncharacterized protein LOC133311282 [Gastrolobium bilobum]
MAIKRNLMKEHQEAIVLESTPTKLSMKCCKYEQGCQWRVRGHRQLDAHVIASLVLGMIRKEPSVSISLVQERITHVYGFKVSYRKAWYAKQKAMAIMYGDWEESYAFLPRWCEYMLRFSPGSVYNIQTDDYFVTNRLVRDKRVFHRIFWTYKQCCEAFNFCKPVIQIDGTHLYGKYKGKLLIATAQDGNAECLPLAFAIVEGETLEAWQYFLDNIRRHVTQKQNICLISDRHRSILSAVESHRGWQPPHAQHVFCLRHIASYTPSEVDFDIAFVKFRDISPEIADWIDQIPKEKVLKGARNMPITGLVKHTYSRLVHYFVEKGQAAAAQLHASNRHCKNIVEAMKFNESLATGHNVRTYNVDEIVFEVDEGYERSSSVNLPQKYCQCGKFKAFKYPCSHAYAAALSVRRNAFGYVDDVFLTENLVHAYSFLWQPIGNEAAIPPSVGVVIIPDRTMLRAKGRPKSTRIRNEMDEVEASQSRIKCGVCKLPGHNRHSCPNRLPNQ